MQNSKINYTAFATFLSEYPSAVSLKRYRALQLRNLLFYQAELARLERLLDEIEVVDAEGVAEREKRVNYRWAEAHAHQAQQPAGGTSPASQHVNQQQNDPRMAKYVTTFQSIRATLDKYNKAIRDYSELEKLPAPPRSTLKTIRKWLDHRKHGAGFLSGADEDVWDLDADMDEFVSFSSPYGFTHPISAVFVFLRRLLSSDKEGQRIYSVADSADGVVGRGVSTIIASVVPILPIIVLFFISSLLVRIGVILAFTGVFAAFMVFGLKLDPDTVLAITTAVAAIQVVYVGSTSTNGLTNG